MSLDKGSSSRRDSSETSSSGAKDLVDKPVDDGGDRPGFGNAFEFFLATLGMAVGLGNLWRFPYVCYMNGGGTFLVPYIFMLIIVGLPVFFNDLALGQFSGASPIQIFGKIAPAFQG